MKTLRHLKLRLGPCEVLFLGDRYSNHFIHLLLALGRRRQRPRESRPVAQGHTATEGSEGARNQPPLASGATCLLRRPPSGRRPRGLTRIVSTRLWTLAASSTDGSGRMSTLSGTLCTAAMQPEWMLPPCAPPLGPGPSGAPRFAPALPSAPPARSPIAPPPARPPPPPRPLTRPGPYHSRGREGEPGPGCLSPSAPRWSDPVPASRNPTWAPLAGRHGTRGGCGPPLGAPRRLPSALWIPGSGSAQTV